MESCDWILVRPARSVDNAPDQCARRGSQMQHEDDHSESGPETGAGANGNGSVSASNDMPGGDAGSEDEAAKMRQAAGAKMAAAAFGEVTALLMRSPGTQALQPCRPGVAYPAGGPLQPVCARRCQGEKQHGNDRPGGSGPFGRECRKTSIRRSPPTSIALCGCGRISGPAAIFSG